ncbi:hypothetical protein VU08_08395 [Desulfobulbus sp. F5]|nr:hypothetical protein [Desulfobulbus sp. F5]
MNRLFVWFAGGFLLLIGSIAQADPIRDNSFNAHQVGWCSNNYGGSGPLSCEDTCQAVGAVPEQETRMTQNTGAGPVCKVSAPSWYWTQELYGKQTYLNGYPVCSFVDQNGGAQCSTSFQCLCVKVSTAGCADLIVERLVSVTWRPAARKTRIVVRLKNIGGATAWHSTTSLADWSGLNPSMPVTPYVANVSTSPISAGEQRDVTFILPYKIQHPQARAAVKVDNGNAVNECRENNNFKWFWL